MLGCVSTQRRVVFHFARAYCTSGYVGLGTAQEEIRKRAKVFSEEIVAPRVEEVEKTAKYPFDIARALAQRGLVGITMPKEYSGQGRGYIDAVIAVEEVSKVSAVNFSFLLVSLYHSSKS